MIFVENYGILLGESWQLPQRLPNSSILSDGAFWPNYRTTPEFNLSNLGVASGSPTQP